MTKEVYSHRYISFFYYVSFFVCSIFNGNLLHAQELEPRLLTNIPLKSNVLVTGYGYASGNILLDPAVQIEDFNAKMNSFVVAYVRSLKIFGMSGKFDMAVPYSKANWTGTYNGNYEEASQTGFGDIRMRFSLNFLGAPSVSLAELKEYKPKTIMGFSAQVIAPTGNYDARILPNLGSNRWALKTQLGLAQHLDKTWILEFYLSGWFFALNNNYLNGQELKQTPFVAIKVHAIKTFSNGMWITADSGYGYGAKPSVNDLQKNVTISSFVVGLSVAVPIAMAHTLRLSGKSSFRILQGPDFDGVFLTYQYFWNRENE